MTRTDAFLFAVKKIVETRRPYIDKFDVRTIQLTVSLSKDGNASVVINEKSEDIVIGCFDGNSRVSKYSFTT